MWRDAARPATAPSAAAKVAPKACRAGAMGDKAGDRESSQTKVKRNAITKQYAYFFMQTITEDATPPPTRTRMPAGRDAPRCPHRVVVGSSIT